MKKIGIITIPDYNNYGNRLQNFAVKQFFSEMGYEVDTLELNDVEFKQYPIRMIKLILKRLRLRPFVYLFEFANGKTKRVKRYKKFERFTEKYLSVWYCPDGRIKTLKKIADRYDYIVLGSDQIWHPTVMTTPNLFFGNFTAPEKVLFFSPSFGVEYLQSEYAQLVKRMLSDKENITVREESGRRIIYDLLGKDAVVLSDPTLCVAPDVWRKLAISPGDANENPYILKFFLGNESDLYREEFARIHHRYGVDIYELEKNGKYGPQEFLGAILNAEYVITDSFHAVVFCIIFNKPFTVFSRLNSLNENEGLDCRIDDLLKKFHIENRKFLCDMTNEIGDIDSSNFSSTLGSIRDYTIRYFEEIMKQ